ncbi:MAG: RNA polymerase sigma factor [Candidatus Limnocylindrales bacterium]
MTDLEAPIPINLVASPPMEDTVGAIYDAHQRELFTFALRACHDREVAEDIVHETYVRLIVEIQRGSAPSNVRAWLYRVTANQAISRGRRTNVAQKWRGQLSPGHTAQDPESEFLDQERASELDHALAELPVDARTALLMAASGFAGQEIATAIGRTESATRTLLSRARLGLRDRLASMRSPA